MSEFIEVRLPRCTVYLTAGEIGRMLNGHGEIYKTGLERGKAFKRANTLRDRIEAKKAKEWAADNRLH
jgi:hypothetical protein